MKAVWALFWLVALGLPLPVSAEDDAAGLKLSQVQVRGNRRSEADAILSVVASRPGTVLDRQRIREDLKAIFQLGFYEDVQVDLAKGDETWVLTFIVDEKPSVRAIRYEGNDELDEDDLKDVVDIKPFGVLDLSKVNRNAEKIKDLYIEKGYFLAEVTWEIIELPDNEVDVLFRIVEKQEVKVAKLIIVGNRAISDKEIKDNLETREGGFLAFMSGAGSFKAEAFDRDVVRVSQYYYDKGYIQARVGQPQIELSRDKREIYLTIPVEEGERFRTGTLEVAGDLLRPKEELMALIALRKGEWFSSGQLRETINAIGELYKDEGYAYVNVVPNTAVNDTERAIGVTFQIDKGKKVRFGQIRVVGNTRTRDKVIRRELRIYEGEYYSSSELKRSKRLVTRLGFFETVELTTSRGATDDSMDVIVEVKEKATGTFQIGAGFSSIESFVAQAQIAQNNLFGRGQSLSLQATLSKIRTIANVRFADDYFLDTQIRFSTNLFRYETDYQDFSRDSTGGDLTLGYPLTDDWSVAATYTLEDVAVSSGGYSGRSVTSISNLFNNGVTSSMRLSVFYDTRNNRLFPSSGWFLTSSAEQATELLLSENLFTRYRLRGRYYFDLGEAFCSGASCFASDMVLKLNSEWGLITSPEKSGVPIFERFFVGGPLSVRGFERSTLGPSISVFDSDRPDAATEAFNIGGTEQLMFNAEFEFPIFQRVGIRGVLFTDAGNAFDRRDPFADKLDSMRFSWGFGVRWFSPIGPLRFEWGFPFAPREDEEESVFDFSIGNFF